MSGFFSALLAECRRREDRDLSLWWSERHCMEQFDRIAQPDGLGVWEEAGNRIVFCLEYDRSTETLERLEKKLKSYKDLQVARGSPTGSCSASATRAGRPVSAASWPKQPCPW